MNGRAADYAGGHLFQAFALRALADDWPLRAQAAGARLDRQARVPALRRDDPAVGRATPRRRCARSGNRPRRLQRARPGRCTGNQFAVRWVDPPPQPKAGVSNAVQDTAGDRRGGRRGGHHQGGAELGQGARGRVPRRRVHRVRRARRDRGQLGPEARDLGHAADAVLGHGVRARPGARGAGGLRAADGQHGARPDRDDAQARRLQGARPELHGRADRQPDRLAVRRLLPRRQDRRDRRQRRRPGVARRA